MDRKQWQTAVAGQEPKNEEPILQYKQPFEEDGIGRISIVLPKSQLNRYKIHYYNSQASIKFPSFNKWVIHLLETELLEPRS